MQQNSLAMSTVNCVHVTLVHNVNWLSTFASSQSICQSDWHFTTDDSVSLKEKSQLHKIPSFPFPPLFPFLPLLIPFVPLPCPPLFFLLFPPTFFSRPFSPSPASPKPSHEAWGSTLSSPDKRAVRTAQIRTRAAHL